jgi:hypothetical protein
MHTLFVKPFRMKFPTYMIRFVLAALPLFTHANLNDIMERLKIPADFQGTGIAGASTLNCRNANNWYNGVKSNTVVGTTHCLAGSFDDYVSWMQNVLASGLSTAERSWKSSASPRPTVPTRSSGAPAKTGTHTNFSSMRAMAISEACVSYGSGWGTYVWNPAYPSTGTWLDAPVGGFKRNLTDRCRMRTLLSSLDLKPNTPQSCLA